MLKDEVKWGLRIAKFSLLSTKHHAINLYKEMDVQLHAFLPTVSDEMSGQFQTRQKISHRFEGCVGQRIENF
jgi:hypothetical protein